MHRALPTTPMTAVRYLLAPSGARRYLTAAAHFIECFLMIGKIIESYAFFRKIRSYIDKSGLICSNGASNKAILSAWLISAYRSFELE